MSGGSNHQDWCAVNATLVAAFGCCGPDKEVARVVRVHPNTVARWRRGIGHPNPTQLAMLAQRYQPIRETFLRMMGLHELAIDAELARMQGEMERLRAARVRRKDDLVAAGAPAAVRRVGLFRGR